MRPLVVVLASLALACGAPRRPDPAQADTVEAAPLAASTPAAETPLVATGERLDDPVSSAIESAIGGELGFPARVVARLPLGDAELVLYAMNGATHWLSTHPERGALVEALEACEEDENETRNCVDRVLRDAREPSLREPFMAACRARNDPADPEVEDACRDEYANTMVFDVEAYCEAGFWTRATPSGDRWSLAPAGRLPEPCLERVLALRAVDLDDDGREELLLDAVYSHMDSMRLVNEHDVRTLSVWHGLGGPALTRSSSSRLAIFGVDMQGDELRCRYELLGATRPSLRLECCELPLEEAEEDDEGSSDYAAMPTPGTCGPRWIETYPPAERGFRECHRVVSSDVALRAAPAEDAAAVLDLRAGTRLRVIEGAEWLEVLADGERGFVPAAETANECLVR